MTPGCGGVDSEPESRRNGETKGSPSYKGRFTGEHMKLLPIEQMPNLSKRLGASGMDRIRYAGVANTEKEPRSINIPNTVISYMQDCGPNDIGCPVADYIAGAAWLDSNQNKPLNINRLYNILQCIELINTREIMKMTGLNKRQAQKYLRAIKFVIPFLERHFSGLIDLPSPRIKAIHENM